MSQFGIKCKTCGITKIFLTDDEIDKISFEILNLMVYMNKILKRLDSINKLTKEMEPEEKCLKDAYMMEVDILTKLVEKYVSYSDEISKVCKNKYYYSNSEYIIDILKD